MHSNFTLTIIWQLVVIGSFNQSQILKNMLLKRSLNAMRNKNLTELLFVLYSYKVYIILKE